jgi:hypothetical protein
MAYSTNPNLPKARAIAMQLLVRDQLPDADDGDTSKRPAGPMVQRAVRWYLALRRGVTV